MKRTTKIIIGLLALIFLVPVVSIIYIAIEGKPMGRQEWILSDKMKSLDLSGISTVWVETGISSARLGQFGQIALRPMEGNENANKFFYSEELAPYLEQSLRNDTLIIRINLAKDKLPEAYRDTLQYTHIVTQMVLNTHSSVTSFRNRTWGMNTSMRGIDRDYFKVEAFGNILTVDSCRLGVLDLASIGNNPHLVLKNSVVDSLKLDLDGWFNWNVVNSDIDTEILSGSYQHNFTYENAECKTLRWIPKTKQARATVTFKDPGVIHIPDEAQWNERHPLRKKNSK